MCNFFQDCISTLPHGQEIHVIEKVLLYSREGKILCKAKANPPRSMLTTSSDGLSFTSAIEYIAQAGAIGRIAQLKLLDQGHKAFGAIIKVNKLQRIAPNIGLDIPLLVYAEYKNVLTSICEVRGSLRNANTNQDLVTTSFNVVEFDK